jgi:hypothetical protein
MKGPALALCCLLAGCGVRLEGGPGSNPGTDGGPSPPGDGPGPGGPDAAPQCSNGRVVYLNFEGQTLTDAATSDATQNRASWMTIPTGTAPRYKTAAADRDQQIQAIVTGVRSQLSSFPITVVTTRPATGPYVMIVYGGTRDLVGSNYGAAVNELDCGDAQKSDVAWISDNVTPIQRVVNTTIGAIGFGIGLTATTDTQDCMCGWANGCAQVQTAACKLSTGIARDPNATQRCQGVTSQDEVAAFEAAFCQ